MTEIKLEKRFPHIPDEDVTRIFQDGYRKGWENARKKAISIEWIKNYARHKASKGFTEIDCYWQSWEEDVLKMVADWEKENDNKN